MNKASESDTQPSTPLGVNSTDNVHSMPQGPNRKARRAAKAGKNRHNANGAGAAADVADKATQVLLQLQGMYQAQARLVEDLRQAFNSNHRAYAQALGAVDGHISVMRAVINDVHRGDAHVDEEGNINWETYYAWYNEHVKQEAETRRVEAEKSGVPAQTLTEEEVEELFGGDYSGGSDESEPEAQGTDEGDGG